MKTYFSRITADHWCAKNKLEEAAKSVAKDMDRKILTEEQVEPFLIEIKTKIREINEEHKRCKPLVITFWQPENYGTDSLNYLFDIAISIPSVFQMSLFLAKNQL